MSFTKDELRDELSQFMVDFARSVERVYGENSGGGLLGHPGKSAYFPAVDESYLERTWLWPTVLTMYDYGVSGIAHAEFGDDVVLDGVFADMELFLRGLDSLEPFLKEDDGRLPQIARRTVMTAVARHILDGGARFHTREDEEHRDYLSFAEVALLADMDERSVRNAANPKLPDALATKNFGRRTLIHIDDARRWLVGRKGFVPTEGFTRESEPEVSQWTAVSVPYPVHQRICALAKEQNTTPWGWIERVVESQERAAR